MCCGASLGSEPVAECTDRKELGGSAGRGRGDSPKRLQRSQCGEREKAVRAGEVGLQVLPSIWGPIAAS